MVRACFAALHAQHGSVRGLKRRSGSGGQEPQHIIGHRFLRIGDVAVGQHQHRRHVRVVGQVRSMWLEPGEGFDAAEIVASCSLRLNLAQVRYGSCPRIAIPAARALQPRT